MNRAFERLYKSTALFGVLTLCGSALGATSSSTLLQVSDNNPAYSETVTLTSFTLANGGFPVFAGISEGTVSFYEDPLPAQPPIPASPGYPTTPGNPASPGYPATSGILLGTANVNHGIAQLSQKFLGGRHTVYAVFSGSSAYPSSTSKNVNMDVKSALAIPAEGAYLGIQAPQSPLSEGAEAEALEAAPPNGVGHTFALHLVYFTWPALPALYDSATNTFQPNAPLNGYISSGEVPVVSWACDSTTLVNGAPIQDSDAVIASIGTANPLPGAAVEQQAITNAALGLAQIPGPVLLRWEEEFNLFDHAQCHGDLNHTTDGNPLDPPNNSNGWEPSSYANFIGAWREIWALFQQAGATNVVFLWNPGNYNYDALEYENPKGFYPGNTFTDWLAVDSYQRKNTAEPSGFDTFQDDVQPFYGDFTASQYGAKPLMIGENGGQNYTNTTPNQEFQSDYLNGVLSDFEANLYPDLKAYDYFDAIGTNDNWLLDSEGGLAAFITLATNPFFDTTSLIASAPTGQIGGVPFASGTTLPAAGAGTLGSLASQAMENQVPVSISLTNNGLLPVTNAQITAITDLKVVAGWGSVTGPAGPISYGTPNLVAGETLSSPVMFTWPLTAVCVQMTVQYSATEATSSQATYSGQNTITVSRFPLGQLCSDNATNHGFAVPGN